MVFAIIAGVCVAESARFVYKKVIDHVNTNLDQYPKVKKIINVCQCHSSTILKKIHDSFWKTLILFLVIFFLLIFLIIRYVQSSFLKFLFIFILTLVLGIAIGIYLGLMIYPIIVKDLHDGPKDPVGPVDPLYNPWLNNDE